MFLPPLNAMFGLLNRNTSQPQIWTCLAPCLSILERFPCAEEGSEQRTVVGNGWPVSLSELCPGDRDT